MADEVGEDFAQGRGADASGDSTNVTWAMHGPATYVSKLVSVFIDVDGMVGKDFEDGLANLKAVAEG